MFGKAHWLFLGVWKVGWENLKVFGVTKSSDYFSSLTVIWVFHGTSISGIHVFPKGIHCRSGEIEAQSMDQLQIPLFFWKNPVSGLSILHVSLKVDLGSPV